MSPIATTADQLTIVNPANLFDPAPFGYSQAVIAPANGQLVYISGQGGADSTGALSPDFATQVKQAYGNLETALDAAGAKPDRVVKLTLYVVDHDVSKLGIIAQLTAQTFGKTLPAQTLVPVPKLALDGMLFEVEAIAVLDAGPGDRG